MNSILRKWLPMFFYEKGGVKPLLDIINKNNTKFTENHSHETLHDKPARGSQSSYRISRSDLGEIKYGADKQENLLNPCNLLSKPPA